MNNEVTKVFSNMTEDELYLVIQEIREDETSGITRSDGIVREKCMMIQKIVGGHTYEQLEMVKNSILKEAAYRFTPTLTQI